VSGAVLVGLVADPGTEAVADPFEYCVNPLAGLARRAQQWQPWRGYGAHLLRYRDSRDLAPIVQPIRWV
jgi:hypothetical protein